MVVKSEHFGIGILYKLMYSSIIVCSLHEGGGGTLIAAVGSARQFKSDCNMSDWLSLTPKQFASGDNTRMGGMRKRGNLHYGNSYFMVHVLWSTGSTTNPMA